MASIRNRKAKPTTTQREDAGIPPTDPTLPNYAKPAPVTSISDWEQCKQMLAMVLVHKWSIALYLLATMGHILTRLSFPIVLGFAITALTAKSDEDIVVSDGVMAYLCEHQIVLNCSTKMDLVNTTVHLIIYINIIGQHVFNFVRSYYGELSSYRISSEIRNRMFHAILWNDLQFFHEDAQNESGNLLSRLCADCNKVTRFATNFIASTMDKFLGILFGVAYALYISPSMTMAMLLCVPIASMLTKYFARYYGDLASKLQDVLAASTQIAMESITNIKTVKALSVESKQEARYAKAIHATYSFAASIAFSKAIFEGIVEVMVFMTIAAVIWYAAHMYLANTVNAGNIVSFLMISLHISMFTKRAVGTYPALLRNIGATKRVFDILNRTPNITPLGGMRVTPPTPCLYGYQNPDNLTNKNTHHSYGDLVVNDDGFEGNIEFKNVCFVYPSRPNLKVIHNLSFRINAGETVGIVGQSGNGKSTIVNLLMRFYDPTEGAILVDGIDLKQYDLRWLHETQTMMIKAGGINTAIEFKRIESV